MYITDALRSLCEFMALPPESLVQRTYNVTVFGLCFSTIYISNYPAFIVKGNEFYT